jgi:orotate phosphoribosyltransferase
MNHEYSFIKLNSGDISYYPIGRFITSYIEICKEIATVLDNLYPDGKISIWCRGSSGAILSALVVSNMKSNNVNICHIKKDGEYSHSSVNTFDRSRVHVIIDDIIATGTTMQYIYEGMQSAYKWSYGIDDYDIIIDALILCTSIDTSKINFKVNNFIGPDIYINEL